MRRLWVIPSFMLAAASSGQGNFPFPTSDAVWKNRNDLWSTTLPIEQIGQVWTSYCMQGADTLINGYQYAVLDDCEGTYVAAIRDSLGKVMIVPADSTSEYLLYDMKIPAGVVDTLEIWLLWHGLMQVTVQGLGPTGPQGRNVIDAWGYQWIEGIGCTSGLLMEPWINISGYWLTLDCMSHADSIFYPSYQAGECAPYNTINEYEQPALVLHPNPVVDVLHLGPMVAGVDGFRITDPAGRTVLTGPITGDDGKVYVGRLAAGSYVLHALSGDRIRGSGIFVVAR